MAVTDELTEPVKVDLETLDLADANRAAFEQQFPGVLADGVVDAERLKELLDIEVVGAAEDRERFGLMWAGKKEAVRSLQTPSRGTLIPDFDASVDWDTARNVFVEGDNLEVLKLLQKAYNNQVKLIYIDPPYNTGSDFVYADNFKDGVSQYLAYSGQVDPSGNRLSSGADTSGRRHSRWLSMMHPRLVLARNLLSQDGVILIHIDENELPRLILLMDEVFGEENSLGEIIWDKRNPKGDSRGISSQHEYVLAYARSREVFIESGGFSRAKASAEEILRMAAKFWSTVGKDHIPADLADAMHRHGVSEDVVSHLAAPVTPDLARRQYARWLRAQPFSGGELAYDKIDENGDVYRMVSMAWPNKKKAPDEYFIPLIHPVSRKPCPVPARGWRNPPDTMARLIREGRILFGEDESTQPQRKYLLRENMYTSVASVIPFGGSDDRLLSQLGVPFDTPKPVELIRQLVGACTSEDDIVMDFFAGSGSTAHGVALQNESDSGRRRCISINIPEPVALGSEAERCGLQTVSDITRKRLLAVLETVPSAREQGLRVFRLGMSNFVRPTVSSDEELTLSISTLVGDPDWAAISSEVLLQDAVPLDAPWRYEEVLGERVLVAAGIAVVLSLNLTQEIADAALELEPKVVVFLEDGFAGADAVKANTVTNAKNAGIVMKTV